MRYRDAGAFRMALEQRLKDGAPDGVALARDRKRVAFDRLLARLGQVAAGRWLLKGGFAPLWTDSPTADSALQCRFRLHIDDRQMADSRRAWSQLAEEVGVSPRFLEQRRGAFIEQDVGSAQAPSGGSDSDDFVTVTAPRADARGAEERQPVFVSKR